MVIYSRKYGLEDGFLIVEQKETALSAQDKKEMPSLGEIRMLPDSILGIRPVYKTKFRTAMDPMSASVRKNLDFQVGNCVLSRDVWFLRSQTRSPNSQMGYHVSINGVTLILR